MNKETKAKTEIEDMLKAGAHFGYSRTKRHASIKSYILGTKNNVDIIDLEKAGPLVDNALEFVKELGKNNKQILFVGSKPEAKKIIIEAATSIDMPYVSERWIGGTLTNFTEIKKRIERLAQLIEQKEKGADQKYTKKERLMIDREIERMNKYFSGLMSMKNIPAAIFVVDSKKEHIAVTEAGNMKVPVSSISNSDCDIKVVKYPMVANDASLSSIKYFTDKIVEAYKEGQASKA